MLHFITKVLKVFKLNRNNQLDITVIIIQVIIVSQKDKKKFNLMVNAFDESEILRV